MKLMLLQAKDKIMTFKLNAVKLNDLHKKKDCAISKKKQKHRTGVYERIKIP